MTKDYNLPTLLRNHPKHLLRVQNVLVTTPDPGDAEVMESTPWDSHSGGGRWVFSRRVIKTKRMSGFSGGCWEGKGEKCRLGGAYPRAAALGVALPDTVQDSQLKLNFG